MVAGCHGSTKFRPKDWDGGCLCCLTPRSSGAPTAGHQAQVGGTLYIFTALGLASCRCRPLSSNVRQCISRQWCASRKCACRRVMNSHRRQSRTDTSRTLPLLSSAPATLRRCSYHKHLAFSVLARHVCREVNQRASRDAVKVYAAAVVNLVVGPLPPHASWLRQSTPGASRLRLPWQSNPLRAWPWHRASPSTESQSAVRLFLSQYTPRCLALVARTKQSILNASRVG